MQLIPGVSTALSFIVGLSLWVFSSLVVHSGMQGDSGLFSSIDRRRTCFSRMRAVRKTLISGSFVQQFDSISLLVTS